MKEIEIELDGIKVKAQENENLLEVSLKNGRYIPHFCYHKKLSIAANCRMCLVEVEKAPKPIPACATKIADGMKVFTNSKLASEAQKGVMEFLLINHPLDCPICDQGGECQLQDLAMDYGKDATRFEEKKRVVVDENLGSLIQTNMTRCIQCSRCVRFTDEIAGYQELGMYYRNNHVRVMSFLERSLDSEISGNVIDLCPVGALTSKPFLYKARNWELSRRKSISSHDSLGSNLLVNIDKYYKVVRVLPLENEEINECWISDRDRFAYNGLYNEQRVVSPMVKQDGKWQSVSWEIAIEYVSRTIYQIIQEQGKDNIGVIASPNSTLEELYLLQKLMLTLGIENLDHRINQTDFSLEKQKITNYLGSSIVSLASADHILLLSTNLRKDQPLLAQRLRQSTKHNTVIDSISMVNEDFLFKTESDVLVSIDDFQLYLLNLLYVACEVTGKQSIIATSFVEGLAVSKDSIKLIVNNLLKAKSFILFGKLIESMENYSDILFILQELSKITGAKIGLIPSFSNSVGASIIEFLPFGKHNFNRQEITTEIVEVDRMQKEHYKNGLNIKEMLEKKLKSYILFNVELDKDYPDKDLVMKALNAALSVIIFSPYVNSNMLEYADVILPIATSYETSGTFINCEGKIQSFNGSTRPYELSRPAWKLIRVLANQFGFANFNQDNINQLREEMFDVMNNYETKLVSSLEVSKHLENVTLKKSEKITMLSLNNIYNNDSIVRRSKPLQETALAKQICVIGVDLANKHNLTDKESCVICSTSKHGIEIELSVIIEVNKNMPQEYAYLMKKSDDDCVDMVSALEFRNS